MLALEQAAEAVEDPPAASGSALVAEEAAAHFQDFPWEEVPAAEVAAVVHLWSEEPMEAMCSCGSRQRKRPGVGRPWPSRVLFQEAKEETDLQAGDLDGRQSWGLLDTSRWSEVESSAVGLAMEEVGVHRSAFQRLHCSKTSERALTDLSAQTYSVDYLGAAVEAEPVRPCGEK